MEEDISTEEILASIRNILLEKNAAEESEPVFELTKDMIYKSAYLPDFNASTDQMIDAYAHLFNNKL